MISQCSVFGYNVNSIFYAFFNHMLQLFIEFQLSEKSNEENDYILPPEVKKQVILIEFLYYEKNETSSKPFLKKFHELNNDLYEIKIKWITKEIRNLFPIKSKSPNAACVIYEVICTCKESYIGEAKRNVEN